MKNKSVCILLIISLSLWLLSGCKVGSANQVERTGYALGTIITIKIDDHGSEAVLDELFNRITEIENRMSVNITDSEVSQINNNAGISEVKVSPDTFFVIQKALEFADLSSGKYNIALGPIITLWGIGTEHARVPSEDEIKTAISLNDYNQILLNESNLTVFLQNENMKIDLGGIAKGYAADEMVRILKEHGVRKAMVNLGGNIFAYGEKTPGTPWNIGIQEPFEDRNNYFGIVSVTDETIVTSGPYERYFEQEGVRYHHIFDNDTGYPVDNSLASVTIIANSSITADALSTSLFALGIQDGLSLVNSMDGVECIFVSEDLSVTLSDGLKERFTIVDQKYVLK